MYQPGLRDARTSPPGDDVVVLRCVRTVVLPFVHDDTRLVAVLTMSGITGATTVVGVLGYPVAHSLSPCMQNSAFAACRLDWVYVPFPVAPAALAEAIGGLWALGVPGVNLTIPHKEAVVPLLASLTPEAAAIGSVNTLLRTPDGWCGHSTDGIGFLCGLQARGAVVSGMRTVVLGAGGAARAVVGALAQAGAASITVVARQAEKAEALAAMATRIAAGALTATGCAWAQAAPAVAQADLLVNATPIGMAPHTAAHTPLPAEWLHPGQWVYDLVYTPRETRLLRDAVARGCRPVDGTGMLVYQGAEAFTRWTGQTAPIAVMEAALAAALTRRSASTNDT